MSIAFMNLVKVLRADLDALKLRVEQLEKKEVIQSPPNLAEFARRLPGRPKKDSNG